MQENFEVVIAQQNHPKLEDDADKKKRNFNPSWDTSSQSSGVRLGFTSVPAH